MRRKVLADRREPHLLGHCGPHTFPKMVAAARRRRLYATRSEHIKRLFRGAPFNVFPTVTNDDLASVARGTPAAVIQCPLRHSR